MAENCPTSSYIALRTGRGRNPADFPELADGRRHRSLSSLHEQICEEEEEQRVRDPEDAKNDNSGSFYIQSYENLTVPLSSLSEEYIQERTESGYSI